MIRAFGYFFFVALAAMGAAWLAERPGTVSVEWIGYRIETSVTMAGLAALLGTAFVLAAWRVVALVLRAPSLVRRAFRRAEAERRGRAVVEGLLAVAAGDTARGRRLAIEAKRLAPDTPLSLLLEAQAAQLDGRPEQADAVFQAMLNDPDARLLGLRGLFVSARRKKDFDAARRLAEEAFDLAPGALWPARALVEMHAAKRDWAGALAALARFDREGFTDKAEAARHRSVLLAAQALDWERNDPLSAVAAADEALRAAPDLIPAALVSARRAAQTGDVRQAVRIIERTWRLEPHPDLADLYVRVRPGDTPQDRLTRAQRLAKLNADHIEGLLALARTAAQAREWRLARESAGSLLRTQPQARVCALMADIERDERGDETRSRDWLRDAILAAPDPAWIADGYVSPGWLPASPVTGALDAFRWRPPYESMEAVVIDVAAREPPPTALTAAAPPPRREPEPALRAALRMPIAIVTPPPSPGALAEAVAGIEDDHRRPRRPDDPGVAEDLEPPRRFGIFSF